MFILNPGFIYLISSVGLFFLKEKYNKFLALITSFLVLGMVYNLEMGQKLILPFLDFELVLLSVDEVSRVIGLVFAFFALASFIYSIKFTTKKQYCLLSIYIGSSLSLVFVADLFSFYVFWELMTIASYFLILDKDLVLTKKTSMYYFLLHMTGAVVLLFGIMLQYVNSGSILLTTVEHGIPFFVIAVAIKMAFVGFHTWLPRSYSEVPFIISVALSAYTTKVGAYGLYRLLEGHYLAYAGLISALFGAVLALKQKNLRKLLSYQIMAQVGFVLVAIGVATSLGAIGGIAHLFNHVLYKGLLFMVVGVIIYTTGKEDLFELKGLAKKLPVTTIFMLIASLSSAGLPLFGGYISKKIIMEGVNSSILVWGLYLVGIATSLVFLKVIYFVFFRDGNLELKNRPSFSMQLGMGLVATLIIIIGVRPQLIETLFAVNLEVAYFDLVSLWEGIQPVLIAVLIFKFIPFIIDSKEVIEVKDIYPVFGQGFKYLGVKLSDLHTGKLNRYFYWLMTTLLVVWFILS